MTELVQNGMRTLMYTGWSSSVCRDAAFLQHSCPWHLLGFCVFWRFSFLLSLSLDGKLWCSPNAWVHSQCEHLNLVTGDVGPKSVTTICRDWFTEGQHPRLWNCPLLSSLIVVTISRKQAQHEKQRTRRYEVTKSAVMFLKCGFCLPFGRTSGFVWQPWLKNAQWRFRHLPKDNIQMLQTQSCKRVNLLHSHSCWDLGHLPRSLDAIESWRSCVVWTNQPHHTNWAWFTSVV